jgi:heme exporter protein D
MGNSVSYNETWLAYSVLIASTGHLHVQHVRNELWHLHNIRVHAARQVVIENTKRNAMQMHPSYHKLQTSAGKIEI